MRIVERMDEGKTHLGLQLACMSVGIVERFAFQYYIAAYALGLHHFHGWRGARHHDGDRHVQPRTVIGKPLRMVAGRRRDHAALALFVGQQQERVERTALLVGGSELVVLELQPDIRTNNLAERLRIHGGGAHHRTRDPLCRGLHIFESEAVVCSGHSCPR
jgi:hypothetical protein